MARLFVFGIGGTGSRVIKSLTMLLASGMKPGNFDTVIPILIDPHKDLNELNECKKLIQLYATIHKRAYSNIEVKEGFFATAMDTLKAASSDNTLKDDIEFDEKHNEPFGDFINKVGIKKISPVTADLLSLLYSDKNFAQPLSVGFKGNPHVGSIVLNSMIGGPAYNAFISTFSENDRIFIISSVFGGTGASGFPLLLRTFRESEKPQISGSQIGVLSVMPYFRLSEPGQTSDIDSNDFMTKTKSALTYYSRQEFTELYNAIYYIADPEKQTEPYKNDEQKQENKAHIVELLGALSIFHFAENKFSRSIVNEYCIGEDRSKINFDIIGNSSREAMGHNLTALHLFSKLHREIKKKANALAFCKINDMPPSFLDEAFFVDEENGLEKFFEEYYEKWIRELDENQRGFSPFNLNTENDFNNLVNGERYHSEKKWTDGLITRPVNMSDLVNRVALASNLKEIKRLNGKDRRYAQYLSICYKGSEAFINSKFKIKDNG